MGCQLESHGAALKAIREAYGSKGLLLCGLDRQEHPWDVEDYVRHFGVKYPIFVDLAGESSPECVSALDSVVVLDRNRRPVLVEGKNPEDPLAAKAVLDKFFAKAGAASPTEAVLPGGQSKPSGEEQSLSPQINQPNWTEPVCIGSGTYPKVIAYGTNQALCVWVAGEVPHQRLLFAAFDGQRWQEARPLPAGQDTHAAALDIDAQAHAVVVWSQKDGGNYRTCLSKFVDAQWREPLALSPPGADAFRPDVLCQPSGEAVVAWYAWKTVQLRDYPNAWWRSIFVTTVAQRRLGPVHELAKLERGSDDCLDPVITRSGNTLRVSWLRDENPPLLFYSARGAQGWSPHQAQLQVKKGRGAFHDVRACSPVRGRGKRSGVVFEMRCESGNAPFADGIHVYFQKLEPSGWAEPVLVSSGPGCHLAPVAVEDGAGACVVFWSHLSGERAAIRMRKLTTAGNPAPKTEGLVSGNCRNLYPSAGADAHGRIYLAWQADQSGVPPRIYASRLVP